MKNNYFKKREKNAHEAGCFGFRGANMTEQLNTATGSDGLSAPAMLSGRSFVWMPVIRRASIQ
ncbi:MAG: hypothetical protein JMN24_12960 [gamma proteobacterium endosymbiont of Lamellibrachia anaximandri]|nr:hypothetical protein [gamma proteobacterium endosymbiont of Lamellibrachia anaximandri]MBL3617444.1 hypothetical protein [gamma proteobacterium endosymbiont of Lamellibrachia anaximandri]